jgi:hypothetical protein
LDQTQLATAFDRWKRDVITDLLVQKLRSIEQSHFIRARNLRTTNIQQSMDELAYAAAVDEVINTIQFGKFVPTPT